MSHVIRYKIISKKVAFKNINPEGDPSNYFASYRPLAIS